MDDHLEAVPLGYVYHPPRLDPTYLTADRVVKKPEGLDLAGLLDLIEAQMAAFLNSGGKVEQIPNGVSGHKDGIRRTPVVVEKKPARAKG